VAQGPAQQIGADDTSLAATFARLTADEVMA
jgi:hypothetical protein